MIFQDQASQLADLENVEASQKVAVNTLDKAKYTYKFTEPPRGLLHQFSRSSGNHINTPST
jgi:RecJ-like exonuclease